MAFLFLTAKLVPAGTPLPPSAQDLVDLVAEYVGIGGLGTVLGVNIGNITPNTEDRDKAWNKLDVDGVSLGWWNYINGSWRPERPIGMISWFGHLITVAPVGYKLLNGIGTYDDEDGNTHPIPNWTDRVPVGSGGTYAPLDVGGVDTLAVSFNLPANTGTRTIEIQHLPPHQHVVPNIGGAEADEGDGGTPSPKVGDDGVTDFVGGGVAFSLPIGGTVGGNIDIRQKYIAAPAIIWVAS